MCVGGDDAGFRDEETGAHGIEALETDDGGLGALDDFFEREFELKGGGLRCGNGGDGAGEGGGDEFEIGVEVIGFDEPVFAVIVAVEVDSVHRAHGERDFASCIAGEREASNHGMFEALAKRGVRAMEVATGKILFKGSGANGDAIEFDGCAGRGAGDSQSVGGRGSNEAEKYRSKD